MSYRKLGPLVALGLALGLLSTARPARADIGIGMFVGEPVGLDIKLGLQSRSALDIVIGWDTYRDGRGAYGHLTYLVTPFRAQGRSVTVPFRLGIGAAVFDDGGRFVDDLNLAVRAPLELGFVFRSTPLELYFELAFKVTFLDENSNRDTFDLDGGVGLRFYF